MKKNKIVHQIDITRIEGNDKFRIKDHIIDEDILAIRINGEDAFQMVFSMTHVQELAVGFLFTQGIVHKKTDIKDIEISKGNKLCHIILNQASLTRLTQFKKVSQTKGSSGGALLQDNAAGLSVDQNKNFTITPDQVKSLIQMHWDNSKLFHETGAVHSAALCNPDKSLSYYEDIGRHNALDKLAGSIFLNEIVTADKIATVSCRMSLEIVGKIIKAGIPIVISNAAPTLKAVKLADKSGLTIIGFARNNRFNIYTHENRIRTMEN